MRSPANWFPITPGALLCNASEMATPAWTYKVCTSNQKLKHWVAETNQWCGEHCFCFKMFSVVETNHPCIQFNKINYFFWQFLCFSLLILVSFQLLLEERFGSTGLISCAGLVSGYQGIWMTCLLLLGCNKHDGTILFELADTRKLFWTDWMSYSPLVSGNGIVSALWWKGGRHGSMAQWEALELMGLVVVPEATTASLP